MREHLDADDPHHRLWLPGRKWMAQRTLSRTAAALLPTPQAADCERGPDYARQRERTETHGSGGDDLVTSVAKLLPTPTAGDARAAGPSQRERNSDPLNVAATRPLLGAARRVAWGVYEAAIRRWEDVLGRDAPPPTDEKGRLDPPFVAWMLGYPESWFDVPEMPRTAQLRCLGNSVQVQCAEAVGGWARALVESGMLLPEETL